MTTTKRSAKAPAKAKKPGKAAAKKPVSAKRALVKRAVPKTLITGGTGFLGSHLVRLLLDRGEKNLRVLSGSVPGWLTEGGVEVVRGSITSAEDVRRGVEGVGSIYHLAGRVSRGREDAHEMYELHVTGTRLLCAAAREAGVSAMVMASTSGTVAVSETGESVADESWPTPLDIISRWPYYASKFYQERAALENFAGPGRRLVMINPSLLLGPGDERLGSTKFVLDFLGRKISATPRGGLSFVDVRDVAPVLVAAMERGRDRERYLLGAANWTFEKLFARLERLTKVAAPRVSLPSKLAVAGSQAIAALYRHWNWTPPVEPAEIEMAEYFWYLDATKAARELGFAPRDPSETLQETVNYVRCNFLGGDVFVN
jgi:dihydroflavonol-4-reductase